MSSINWLLTLVYSDSWRHSNQDCRSKHVEILRLLLIWDCTVYSTTDRGAQCRCPLLDMLPAARLPPWRAAWWRCGTWSPSAGTQWRLTRFPSGRESHPGLHGSCKAVERSRRNVEIPSEPQTLKGSSFGSFFFNWIYSFYIFALNVPLNYCTVYFLHCCNSYNSVITL